jgi:gliding motility-associated-like protein
LQVHIPNAFTPDGNGNNDFFKPVIAGSEVREYYFAIFDRWGNVVYETEDLEGCWNGQVHNTGAEAQDGVYNWVLKIRSIDQPVIGSQQGFVLLIR